MTSVKIGFRLMYSAQLVSKTAFSQSNPSRRYTKQSTIGGDRVRNHNNNNNRPKSYGTMTNDLTVTVEQGQLRGKTAEDFLGGKFYSFLGVPYAKPPVGELRFKAPVPAEPWEGVRDATCEASECPSTHMFFTHYIGNEEDCLNLNIHTKELPKPGCRDKLKPVMVWIHGGGFLFGCNKAELFGPDYLMSEDIVLVSINYRLGVLGFLSLDDPSLGVPGNAGMKDMIMALKWIQKNIPQFGGDPNNVTIFGESAGGASVHYLYLSPMSKGLFHKAIAQSGSALNPWAKGVNGNAHDIANVLGYKETDEKKLLQHLRSLPTSKIVKAQMKIPDVFQAITVRPFGPVVEKPSGEAAFLSEDPVEIMKKGTYNRVPLMMGYTSREGIFFEIVKKMRSTAGNPTDFETEIIPDLNLKRCSDKSKEVADKIKTFYYGDEKPSANNTKALHLLKSDVQFIHGIHRAVASKKLHQTAPLYFYRLSLETSINYYKTICTTKALYPLFSLYFLAYKAGEGSTKNLFLKLASSIPCSKAEGVCHADDVGYLFRSFLSPKLEPDGIEHLAVRRYVKLWTNFARCGQPTPDVDDELLCKVKWDPVSKNDHVFLDIDQELKVGKNPDSDRMKFWDSLYA